MAAHTASLSVIDWNRTIMSRDTWLWRCYSLWQFSTFIPFTKVSSIALEKIFTVDMHVVLFSWSVSVMPCKIRFFFLLWSSKLMFCSLKAIFSFLSFPHSPLRSLNCDVRFVMAVVLASDAAREVCARVKASYALFFTSSIFSKMVFLNSAISFIIVDFMSDILSFTSVKECFRFDIRSLHHLCVKVFWDSITSNLFILSTNNYTCILCSSYNQFSSCTCRLGSVHCFVTCIWVYFIISQVNFDPPWIARGKEQRIVKRDNSNLLLIKR